MSTTARPRPRTATPSGPAKRIRADDPVSVEPGPGENVFVIRGVDYATYVNVSDALGEDVWITFDGEHLYFMAKSPRHETLSRFFGIVLQALAEELDVSKRSYGSMTCRTVLTQRGIEPDECFYLRNEPLIRGNLDLNLDHDPPPDLGIEIDLSRSSIGRLPIYAKLRVPEVWRYNGEQVLIYLLQPDQSYVMADHSAALPIVTAAQLTQWLTDAGQQDETALAESVRLWVQSQRP